MDSESLSSLDGYDTPFKHVNDHRIAKQQEQIMKSMGYSSHEEVEVVDVHDECLTNIGNLFIEFTNLQIIFASKNLFHSLGDIFLCPKLVKIDISGNKLAKLPPQDFWHCLQELKILYVHDNQIADWRVVTGLHALPQLRILTMHNNPIAQHANFRHFMINMTPTLHRLDDYTVTDEEFIEGADFSPMFHSLREDLLAPPPVYPGAETPARHVRDTMQELYHHRVIYEQNSPGILIKYAKMSTTTITLFHLHLHLLSFHTHSDHYPAYAARPSDPTPVQTATT